MHVHMVSGPSFGQIKNDRPMTAANFRLMGLLGSKSTYLNKNNNDDDVDSVINDVDHKHKHKHKRYYYETNHNIASGCMLGKVLARVALDEVGQQKSHLLIIISTA